jgi:hypothetical protein
LAEIFVAQTGIDYARKRNRKEALANYNKTSINIAHQHDSWMEFKGSAKISNS